MLVRRYRHQECLEYIYVPDQHGDTRALRIIEGLFPIEALRQEPPDPWIWSPHPDLGYVVVDDYFQYAGRVLPQLRDDSHEHLVGVTNAPRNRWEHLSNLRMGPDCQYFGEFKCRALYLGDCQLARGALLFEIWRRR
jgi:hypothetical protein